MAELVHGACFVVTRTRTGVEFRVEGQRRPGRSNEVIFRAPLGRVAAHRLALALLQACVPDEGEP